MQKRLAQFAHAKFEQLEAIIRRIQPAGEDTRKTDKGNQTYDGFIISLANFAGFYKLECKYTL